MAKTANFSVAVSWGGSVAAKGLAKFTDGLNALGSVANKSRRALASLMPTSLFSAAGIKSLNDVKSGIEMVRGVFQTFVGTPIIVANNILIS